MKRLRAGSSYFDIAQRAGEIPELDGLRGLAILLVMLRHAAHPVYEAHGRILDFGDWDIAVPLLNGWMGVDLFFVLSGFLITHHLLKRWPSRWNWEFAKRYLLKRVLRTFPAFYAAVMIAFFGLIPLYEPIISVPAYTLTTHLLFLQDYLGSELVPAFWSLGVEEKFYIVCPFVLIFLKNRPNSLRIPVLIMLALIPLALRLKLIVEVPDQLTSYPMFFWMARSPFHLAMDGLWTGVICAMLYNTKGFAANVSSLAVSVIFWCSCAVLLWCLFAVAWFDHLHMIASAVVIAAVSAAFGGLLLAVSCGQTPINGLLRSRWLRIMAILSYSLYLMHMMLIPLSRSLAQRILSADSATPLETFLVFLPIFFMISLVAALLLHYAVEKPFLLLKDRIKLSIQSPMAQLAEPS